MTPETRLECLRIATANLNGLGTADTGERLTTYAATLERYVQNGPPAIEPEPVKMKAVA